MPIEFAEGLLENDDFRVETDTNGDLIQEHKQTGAQFKFDSTKNTWVPVQGLDLEGANLDNAALGTALDANNNDINNASAIESASVSTGSLNGGGPVSDGDGTERQIWVIANGASDPAEAAPEDIIFEEES